MPASHGENTTRTKPPMLGGFVCSPFRLTHWYHHEPPVLLCGQLTCQLVGRGAYHGSASGSECCSSEYCVLF